MIDQEDSVGESNTNEGAIRKPLAVGLLYQVELLGLRMEYGRLKKTYPADAWWILRQDEATGPHAFDDGLRLLLDGTGSIAVVHETCVEEESPPWQTLAYRPLGLNPYAVCFWKIGFGAVCAFFVFAFASFLVPARLGGYFELKLALILLLGMLWQFPKQRDAIGQLIRRGLLQIRKRASVRNVTGVAFLALCLLLLTGYRRVAVVHDTLNEALPWVKSLVTKWRAEPPIAVVPVAEAKPAGSAPSPMPLAPVAVKAEPSKPGPEQVATPSAADATIDLEALSRSPAEWPKTVTLNKVVKFPAVLNGTVIGSVQTSPGMEVRLTQIRAGKIGVEFKGGTTTVDAKDSDLMEQVLARRK